MLKLILRPNFFNSSSFSNLNTSHVKVNPILWKVLILALYYLNTSHVKVNQMSKTFKRFYRIYLNTSHVKVNPLILSHSYISIIPFKSYSIKLL